MIEHEVWEGENYAKGIDGQKLFIIGNSHYFDDPGSERPDFTKRLVADIAESRNTDLAFFNAIQKAFDRSAAELWHRVVFFNFVPWCIGTKAEMYKIADPATKERARRRFMYLLGKLSPDKVLVFSNSEGKGWRILPETDEELLGHSPEPLKGFDHGSHYESGTYNVLGKPVKAFGLKHTQGRKSDELRQAVIAALEA